MNANELADELTKMFRGEEYDRLIHEIPDMLRQQKNEIEDLKNANRFIQNFAEWEHKRAVALEMRELTDEAIEKIRVAIMGAAYWCADENMPEAYNAVKVCCGQVLGILDKAQNK